MSKESLEPKPRAEAGVPASTPLLQLTALAAVSFLLAISLFEVGLTFFFQLRDSHNNLVMVEGSPFLFTAEPGTAALDRGIAYRVNNHGMRRGTDVATVPAAGTTRILSYGDSIANGWGVEESEAYAAVLDALLGEGGEVLNMYRGVSPTITSFHIRRDVPRLKPDGVLLEIELLNDVSDEASIATRGRDADGLPTEVLRSRYILGFDGHLLTSRTRSGSWLERTKTWSMVSRVAGEVSGRLSGPHHVSEASGVYYYHVGFDRHLLTPEALAAAFDRMFDRVAGIRSFLERHGVDFLLVLVPSRHAYADGPYREHSRAVYQAAEARARQLGLPTVSTWDALAQAGGDDVFLDFCHPDPRGHRAIAEVLSAAVSGW